MAVIKTRRRKASRRILEQIDADSAERTLSEIRATDLKTPEDRLFRRTYWRPVMLAFLIAAFNQLSGINFIIYFAPRIFSLAGARQQVPRYYRLRASV